MNRRGTQVFRAAALVVVGMLLVGGCGAVGRDVGLPKGKGASGTPLKVFAGWRGSADRPFHEWNPSEPRPRGFEPALIERVAQLMGRSVVYVQPTLSTRNPRIEMLVNGQADAVISTFSITPQRSKQVSFSRPYYHDGIGALVLASSSYRQPTDLSSRRIMAVSGTSGEAWVRANWPSANLTTRPLNPVDALVTGRIDA